MHHRRLGGAGSALAVWLLVGASWAVSPALAGETETYGVAPHPPRVAGAERRTFAVPLESGQMFEDAVRVYNRTSEPIVLALYAADATVGRDGVVAVGFRGSRPTGLGAAVDLDRHEVPLAPETDAIVPFTVTVPDDATSDHLAAVVVENQPASAGALDVVQRVAVLIRPAAAGTSTGARQVEEETGFPWWLIAFGSVGIVAALRARVVIRNRHRRRIRVPSASVVPDPDPPAGQGPSPDPSPVPVTHASELRAPLPDLGADARPGPAADAAGGGRKDPGSPQTPRTKPQPRRSRTPSRPPAAKKKAPQKLNYIPLDEL